MKHLSTAALIIALLVIPAAIWLEDSFFQLWQQRLYSPNFEPEPNKHTPLHTDGTYLPPVIKENLSLSPAGSPYLIAGSVHLEPGITLTIAPGTTLYAHEFASLKIAGTLLAVGNQEKPIIFSSNEVHELNRAWGGLIVQPGGRLALSSVVISHASPGVSCLENSTAHISDTTIQSGSVGIFTHHHSCQVADSLIRNVRDGIISLGAEPKLTNTRINASRQNIKAVK